MFTAKELFERRRARSRAKLRKVASGQPRLTVHRSSKHIYAQIVDDVATVKPRRKTKLSQSLWGTMRATINNMVIGVGEGFTRKLEINGVGYRAAMQGNKLVLSLGYSHPVEMDVPAGLTVAVENNT